MDDFNTRFANIWSDSFAGPDNWFASALMAPMSFGLASCDYWAQFSEVWWKNVFTPAYHHAHEDHCQLEVPDPIEEDGEHDLFA